MNGSHLQVSYSVDRGWVWRKPYTVPFLLCYVTFGDSFASFGCYRLINLQLFAGRRSPKSKLFRLILARLQLLSLLNVGLIAYDFSAMFFFKGPASDSG